MKVFLSHALPPYDDLLPSRLRANAIAYNVEILIPDPERGQQLSRETLDKIRICSAVISLVAQHASSHQIDAVNSELKAAAQLHRPVVALVESQGLVQNVPPERTVLFNRFYPGQHEVQLFQVLSAIEKEQKNKDLITALGAIGLIAIGLYTFGELTKDE